MADDELRGAVHWIDHFVVGTNDLVAWADWAVNATGVAPSPIRGVTTAARKRNQPFQCFLWWDDPSCRMGAFLQSEMYPPSKELGHDTPLCGFYVRPEDMDRHVQRLDRHAIPHTSPARIETEGDPGITVFCLDDRIGHQVDIALDKLIVEFTSDQPFDGENRVVWIGHGLALG